MVTSSELKWQNVRSHKCSGICCFTTIVDHLVRAKNYSFGKTPGEITRNLYQRFLAKMEMASDMAYSEFPGVKMDQFDILEDLFGIGISVFSFQTTSETHIYPKGLKASVLRNTTRPKGKTPNGYIDTLRYNEHLMLISNLSKALGDTTCSICDKRLLGHHFARHVRSCAKSVGVSGKITPQIIYPECQQYRPPRGVLDELQERYNVPISKSQGYIVSVVNFLFYLRIYGLIFLLQPWLATYDSETMTKPLPGIQGNGTKVVGEIFPFILGICSNLPNEDPPYRFFMASEVDDYRYIARFVSYLVHLGQKAAKLCEERVLPLKQAIQHQLQKAKIAHNKYGIKYHEQNLKKLDGFIHSFPCIGFNSSVSPAPCTNVELHIPHVFRLLIAVLLGDF